MQKECILYIMTVNLAKQNIIERKAYKYLQKPTNLDAGYIQHYTIPHLSIAVIFLSESRAILLLLL